MAKNRKAVPRSTRQDILAACNNRCCVCQTPFVVLHHIDEDPSNNAKMNLAPLCPNCHSQAHSCARMTTNLTPEDIVALRDKWYAYCERRREAVSIGPNAMLKLKNFVRSMGRAQYGWAKTFADVDPAYRDMAREEIINQVFATSNRDDLSAYLETVKQMYQVPLCEPKVVDRFAQVCNAFGFDYENDLE